MQDIEPSSLQLIPSPCTTEACDLLGWRHSAQPRIARTTSYYEVGGRPSPQSGVMAIQAAAPLTFRRAQFKEVPALTLVQTRVMLLIKMNLILEVESVTMSNDFFFAYKYIADPVQ